VTSDHNDPDLHLEHAYQQLLKELSLRGNTDVAATAAFRPLTAFLTALHPVERVLVDDDDLFQRCQRAIDRARRLCDAAEQIVSISAAPRRLSRA
jgi:hypothetical protein